VRLKFNIYCGHKQGVDCRIWLQR